MIEFETDHPKKNWRNDMKDFYSPDDPPEYPECPECGSTDYEDVFIVIRDGGPKFIGCSCCMCKTDAFDYWEREMQKAKEIHDDMVYERMRDEIRFGG